jgi:hypothetical protein
MVGMKEFCALLLAGGMGAGSVVAVQQVKPSISKRAPAKPKVQKTVQRAAQTTQISECPTVAPIGPGMGDFVPLQTADSIFSQPLPGQGGGFGSGGSGGGGFGPSVRPDPVPVVPAIPQPDTWVMLVAGFGFLGLALRRRKRPEAGQAGFQDR